MKVVVLLALACATASAAPCKKEVAKGDFGLDHDRQMLRIYRLATCAQVATIAFEGRFAFASILETTGMPTIVIDTWVMHGDRKRQTFVWAANRYVQSGNDELVLGPRKRP